MVKSEIAAQGQLDAYNNRNIDNFMKWYADDVKIYDIDTNELMYEGKEAMRPKYSTKFENIHLHCGLKNRMVLGATVIDHEVITTDDSGETYEAIAIYIVNRVGLIETVRFTKGIITV